MVPVRLSIATLNLWNTERWSLRVPVLGKFLDDFRPDVLCVQELRPESQAFLDGVMPEHTRIHDDFIGWNYEGNIYWNKSFFNEMEHGAEDIGLTEKNRRLFWVRLKLRAIERTIFVSTAHFTYQEHPDELKSGRSPRVQETHNTIMALQRLVKDDEPAFFMGDLNDTVHPILLLHHAGYNDCFSSQGLLCPPTFPSYPTARFPADNTARFLSQTRDWIVANKHARTVLAQVPQYYYADMAPSDHWPVLAVYEVQTGKAQMRNDMIGNQ